MLIIKKEDFELLPSKMSIARLYAQHLSLIAKYQHQATHEQIYEEIEKAHIEMFKHGLPWPSYDSFRKFFTKYRKEIYCSEKDKKREKSACF